MLLTEEELLDFNPEASVMAPGLIRKYLAQANAYCVGYIGGVPKLIDDNIRAAVAMAFEMIAEGQSSQTNPFNGNITDVAPTNAYTRKESDPMALVKTMLGAAKDAYEKEQEEATLPPITPIQQRGIVWLGGPPCGPKIPGV